MESSVAIKRYDALKYMRHNIEGIWDVIEKFVVPYRGKYFSDSYDEGEIEWRRRDLYDSTAVIANQNLAANMHSGLTNPTFRWFNARFRDEELNEMQEVKAWSEMASEILFYSLQQSNFNLQTNEVYLDLCSLGTAPIVEEVEEDESNGFKGLDFTAIPPSELVFEADYMGDPINVFRLLRWTAIQILDKFGPDGTPLKIQEDAKKPGAVDKKIDILFCVTRRPGNRNRFDVVSPIDRQYEKKYILYTTGQVLGDVGGYYEMPVFIPRWRKVTGSAWGHSPAMICLSDILTLNQMTELILKAGEKVIDPPIMTTRRGIFGDVDLDAAGVTMVQDMNSMKVFESGARFDVSQLQKSELQESINKTFFMDQLQLKESPAMTATEVQARFQLMQRLLGPTLGRLQSDYLDPLIKRTFGVLYRYGMIPEVPRVVRERQGQMDIEYVGPMAKSQRIEQASAIERYMGNIAASAEMYPELKLMIDPIKAGYELAHASGVPAKILRSKGQINSIMKQRKEAAAKQREIQMSQEGGDAAKAVGEGASAMKEAGIEGGQGAGAAEAAA